MIRTKNDIIKKLTDEYNLDSVSARRVVGDVLNGIIEAALEHGKIEIRRFGTFKVCHRAPRVARNPRTNEPLKLPSRHVLTFEPSEKVTSAIAEKYHDDEYIAAKEQYSFEPESKDEEVPVHVSPEDNTQEMGADYGRAMT